MGYCFSTPHRVVKVALLTLSFSVCLVAQSFAQQPEMRAYWCSRFEWPRSSETATKNNIRAIFDKLEDNNFNAVLFQVRGEMNTLYPSPYEPWGPQFNWTNPGWDPMAFAIEEAHARGLEFHAYINTHTMIQDVPPSNTTPQHVYNIHGPGSAESWSIHDESGNPVGITDAYVWLSPGVPEVSAWTRREILYIVQNYDVDGVHFDRIRTPAPGYSHDPIAEARFAGDGNPDNEAWGDFMRSQITRDLRKIYGEVQLYKPHVKISSAPFGICRRVPGGYQGTGTQSYYSWNQDSFGWMEDHVMDVLFPQIYWEIGSAHPFEVLLDDFQQFDGGRHIYPGINASNNELAQILQARTQGALGSTIWPGGTVDFAGIKAAAYQQKVAVPKLPWKTDPQVGYIVGHVTDARGEPILDAKISINGDSYNYLSAFDGFYSILDREPGQYQIVAEKTGYGIATGTVEIAKGDVKVVNLQFPSFTVDEIIDNDEPGFSMSGNWQVSDFGNNYGADKRYLNVADSGASVFAEWTFENIPPAQYRLNFWANDNAYVDAASYQVTASDEAIPESPITVSQRYQGDGWHDLSIFNVTITGSVTVRLDGEWTSPESILLADAMRLQLLAPLAVPDPTGMWLFY